ncbi:MAG: DDE-type integrase/transposase/recombinase [Ferruginibacter sp.]
MNAYLTKLIMYHEIHRMDREGLSVSQICRALVLNWRTVKNHLSMSEREFDRFMERQSGPRKNLLPYESFIKDRLEQYPDTSAAQMHDWLKEHFPAFPLTAPKTVFNFIVWVRQHYYIPKINITRDYEVVEELPYGQQAQADFGEYNLRDNQGKRVKVFFFTIVLSRSRFKFIWFQDQYFTTELAIEAHEKAFAFFGGIPGVVVYDQDKLFIVSENKGDLILTARFRAYTSERPFKLHFCRRSDPESKGKVENVVKYTKQNFLYNRAFSDLETLNQEALGWLGRTANMMTHGSIKKEPWAEWNIEKSFLTPYLHYAPVPPSLPTCTVRKDNTIYWKSNLYSVPLGTYKGRGSKVTMKLLEGHLVLSDLQGQEICRHLVAAGTGKKIKNNDHKRDKSTAINKLIDELSGLLDNPLQGKQFLNAIRQAKPRYIRDQVLLFKQTIQSADKVIVQKALDYCCDNQVVSANDFKAVVEQFTKDDFSFHQPESKIVYMNPLNKLPAVALTEPAASLMEDYETILKSNLKG